MLVFKVVINMILRCISVVIPGDFMNLSEETCMSNTVNYFFPPPRKDFLFQSGGTALPDMICDPLSVVASEAQ